MADIQPSKALQFPAWTNDNHCLARRVLNCDLWEQLKDFKTSLTSFTINDVVRSGVAVPTSSNGVYAGDEECYRLYSQVFEPIIKEYHGMDKIPAHVSNLDSRCLTSVIHNEASILSTRCRVVRNLYGYGFPPGMSREKRLEVERILVTALESLGGDLSGTYYPYDTMTSSEKQSLIKDGYLFQESDKYQAAAGICRDWPEGRGIFYNNAKTFLVWVNEEDHLRIISMQKGADVQQVFNRLCRGIHAIDKRLLNNAQTAFAFDKQYGYLSSCPTNLGTGMRTSVHMRVPNAFNTAAEFKSTCGQLGLDVRGKHGETSEASEKAVCDVSNRQRMGRTEVELLKILIDGINSLNQYAISG
ncbi:PREDICTED: arginine kinase-like [Branchiostoma belcheri]|uniref:creatine kinase n=1 Tax=Branchiostoma belcheri TaxID=7741 RepID=A0A6P4Y8F3_BRABE|nr:PREDICTED: arginine kinase-like [Branchiostoma belcheri]